jgi:8-oxo-dGTP pyrophosphatase MutT (NUDIX family)
MGNGCQVNKIYHQAAVLEIADADFALPEGPFPPTRVPSPEVVKLAQGLKAGHSFRLMSKALGASSLEILLQLAGCFTIVEAAGGIVQNELGEILLIYRRGWWDLPKGKLDPGETPAQAALREVEEETGLAHLQLGQFFGHCYHIYPLKKDGEWAFKPSHWYAMRVAGCPALKPQAEEQIERADWVPLAQLGDYLPKMFPSLADLLMRWQGTHRQ